MAHSHTMIDEQESITSISHQNKVVEDLLSSTPGSHSVVIYQNLDELREIYSKYTKAALERGEMILIWPFYESTESVRSFLGEAEVNLRAEKKVCDLLTIDSYDVYHQGKQTAEQIWQVAIGIANAALEYAERTGKYGVTIIADMGSFYAYDKIDLLVDYERAFGKKLSIQVKGICCHSQVDFDKLTAEQKELILNGHLLQAIVPQI